jgi:peptidoglycan/LPS O-acetylase OafA/YrhL
MFYLFFPLLCMVLVLRRWGFAVFLTVLCGLVVFGPFARTPWYTKNEVWAYQSYLGNMDNVALGCLFAMLANYLGKSSQFLRSQWPRLMEWMGAALVLFIVFWDWPRVILGWHVKYAIGHTETDVTVLGLGTCLMMLGSVLRPTVGRWWSAPLRWLGRHSYEVYLTHEFIVMGVLSLYLRTHRGPAALWIAVVLALSGLLGFLVARFVSEPMNRILRGAPVVSGLTPASSYEQGRFSGEVAEFRRES